MWTPPPRPAEIESLEALYLAGLHLETHGAGNGLAEEYHREAIRRDPRDIRNNAALGRALLRRGELAGAEVHLRTAVATQTRFDAHPHEGEPSYSLGLCLRLQGRWQLGPAREWWERSRRWGPAPPAAHRGLAIVHLREGRGPRRALRCLELALRLDPGDHRLALEVDYLRKRSGATPEQRVSFLDARRRAAGEHEDLSVELMTLLNTVGRHRQALAVGRGRRLDEWSPGLARLAEQQVLALVEIARRRALASRLARALDLLERARSCAGGIGADHHGYRTRIAHWQGVVLDLMGERALAMGERALARESWNEAATGSLHDAARAALPVPAPEGAFYRGLALDRLGDPPAARDLFTGLLEGAGPEPSDGDGDSVLPGSDFPADDDAASGREAGRRFAAALGAWGLGRRAAARRELTSVLGLDSSHQSAHIHLRWLRDEASPGDRP